MWMEFVPTPILAIIFAHAFDFVESICDMQAISNDFISNGLTDIPAKRESHSIL